MKPEYMNITLTANTRQEVVKLLDELAADWPEKWRKVYKMRGQTSYRGFACYEVGWQGLSLDLRK